MSSNKLQELKHDTCSMKLETMTVQKLLFFITALIFLTAAGVAVAAPSLNQVAYNIEIKETNPQNGSIVAVRKGIYVLSDREYDPGIYAVIQEDAAITLNEVGGTTRPVVTNGQANVRVTKANGDIKEGDLITSSKDKGVGQKATKSGHVLGKALADFPTEGSSEDTGLIPVLISISYNQFSVKTEELTQSGLDKVAKKVSTVFVSGPLPDLFKYIFALLLGLISFFWGLAHFVRTNRTAVEAVARNPLAKGEIRREQIIGSVVILIACSLGLGVAVGILVFL